MPEAASAPPATAKPRQGRSPAYPFISLKTAIERADAFRVAEGGRPRHFAPTMAAAKAWSLGPKTGDAKQTIAALGHYGLFEFQGAGDNRSVRLTDMALRILLDKQPISPERDQLLREAALAPNIHAELWKKWGAALPSSATIETYLVRDRGFSENGARDLMAEYKETIAFSRLEEPANIPALDEGLGDLPPAIAVGDMVQVEIGGVAQFKEPQRVRAVGEHGGKPFIFIDGEVAGIPMENAQVVQKAGTAVGTGSQPPILPLPDPPKRELAAGMKEEKNSLDEGEAVLIWPETLSADSVRDLEYWLNGILQKAKRRAGLKEEKPS